MSNIATGLTNTMILNLAGQFFTAFAPYIELLVGVLLAFFIIKIFIENMIQARYEASPEGREARLMGDIERRESRAKEMARAEKVGININDYFN